MIFPENPKAQAELKARIKRNLEAGDWGPSPIFSSTRFVPMDEDGKVLQEDELSDDNEKEG